MTQPVPAFTAPPIYRRITTAAFWDRFTTAELVDYDVAMQHDPAATTQAKKAAARLRVFRREASDAGNLRITAPRLVNFVADLVTASIIAAPRQADILAPVTAAEAWPPVIED